jgi:hypothetical protein
MSLCKQSSLRQSLVILIHALEAFLKAGDRSIVSYLVRPMSDQIARAFREK